MLEKLKVSDKEIDELKKEKDRADKIADLYKDNIKVIDDYLETSKSKSKEDKKKEAEDKKEKEKPKLSKEQKKEKEVYKLNKKEQINMLIDNGWSMRRINGLKYEKDRVEAIMKLEKK